MRWTIALQRFSSSPALTTPLPALMSTAMASSSGSTVRMVDWASSDSRMAAADSAAGRCQVCVCASNVSRPSSASACSAPMTTASILSSSQRRNSSAAM